MLKAGLYRISSLKYECQPKKNVAGLCSGAEVTTLNDSVDSIATVTWVEVNG